MIQIHTALSEEESRMVISALRYVRHPQFLDLASRLEADLETLLPISIS